VANIKSQIKRNKQNERARARNKSVRSALKTAQKKVREAVAAGDQESASARNLEAARALDKAVSAGAIHKRTAARRKSRLAGQLNRATTSSGTGAAGQAEAEAAEA
jgi:small subunit ribosomal protein S20